MEQRPVDHATDEIFSFLPSKAGVGASTIALNVSAALARRPNTRVLLSDFDLNSGMIRFMLKLSNTHSVLEAVEHASIMEQELLSQLVSEIDRLEVLHAGPINPNYRIDPGQIRSLISFLRRSYRVLCFDLSGNLERYSLELMQESKRIILVCTAEVPSIHMAREKMRFLKTLDLDGRVMVVLNRSHRKMLFTKNQVEQMLDSGQDCVSQ
jgi:pilus assembly protein CpaE